MNRVAGGNVGNVLVNVVLEEHFPHPHSKMAPRGDKHSSGREAELRADLRSKSTARRRWVLGSWLGLSAQELQSCVSEG